LPTSLPTIEIAVERELEVLEKVARVGNRVGRRIPSTDAKLLSTNDNWTVTFRVGR